MENTLAQPQGVGIRMNAKKSTFILKKCEILNILIELGWGIVAYLRVKSFLNGLLK